MQNLSRFKYIYNILSNKNYCFTNKFKNADLKILKAYPCSTARKCCEDTRIPKKKKKKKKKSKCVQNPNLGKFNIFAEQCHWIRQLQGDEEDPTHEGEYFHHQMYHKYTFFDVAEHLTDNHLPQPSIKTPLNPPKPPPPPPPKPPAKKE